MASAVVSFAAAALFYRYSGSDSSVCAVLCAAFLGADWGAQNWSAREARVRSHLLGELTDAPGVAQLPVEPPLYRNVRAVLSFAFLVVTLAVLSSIGLYHQGGSSTAATVAVSAPLPSVAPTLSQVNAAPALSIPPLLAAPQDVSSASSTAITPSQFDGMEAAVRNLGGIIPGLGWTPEEYKKRQMECQGIAKRFYADLGTQGSPLNRKFLELYNQHKAASDGFFAEPDWPVRLTKESVGALQEAGMQ